jgi:hypothetical protein
MRWRENDTLRYTAWFVIGFVIGLSIGHLLH